MGFGVTIAIFIIKIWDNNVKFKAKQDKESSDFRIKQEKDATQFQTTTNLKLIEFEKELTILKSSIQLNRTEIIDTYQRYKEETINHTLEFRNETKEALHENKVEHADIKTTLGDVSKSLEFIKGKLSTAKERKDFDNANH